MKHELKTWPESFQAMRHGYKHFDLRPADRNYGVGDVLILREFDPQENKYTGHAMVRCITYILWGGNFGLPEEFCILGLEPSDMEYQRQLLKENHLAVQEIEGE